MFARRQFSLRTILVIIAFVALFMALRKAYVFDTQAASSTIRRAWQMPALFAGLTVAASLIGSTESRFKRSTALGAIIATIVAAELATEIAEGIRRTSTYWIWSSDWPQFLAIVLSNTLIGGVVGFVVACMHKGCLRVFSARKKPATPV